MLRTKGFQVIPDGDRLILELPGGGGMGDPATRDPATVARDVRDGLVSAEAAQGSLQEIKARALPSTRQGPEALGTRNSGPSRMDRYLLALIGFTVVATISPGPNNVIVASIGAQRGAMAAMPYILGVAIGWSAMILLVGTGLTGVIARMPALAGVCVGSRCRSVVLLAWRIATASRPGEGAEAGCRASCRPCSCSGSTRPAGCSPSA